MAKLPPQDSYKTKRPHVHHAALPPGTPIPEGNRAGGLMSPHEAAGMRKPRAVWDDDLEETFLKELRRCGVLKQAAIVAGVKPYTVDCRRKDDPEFDEAVRDSLEMHQHDLLMEMRRRAVEGVTRPIIGGQFKDEVVAHEQVYSDGLLSRLVEVRVDGFSRDKDADTGGGGGGVLIVPNRMDSLDDWERIYGEAARGRTGRPTA